MQEVAISAFCDPQQIVQVKRWFTERRAKQFARQEAALDPRCGAVDPGVRSDVERLLRQARRALCINGQCTVDNLKRLLMAIGLMTSGPKVELIQRVHNYMRSIQAFLGVQGEAATVVDEDVDDASDDDDNTVVTLFGVAAIDDLLISVAGADGFYVA